MNESDYMEVYEQLGAELEMTKEAYDALWKEKELLLKVLKDWQEFAADVRASDAAGQDWLDGLKARTARIVDPCS